MNLRRQWSVAAASRAETSRRSVPGIVAAGEGADRFTGERYVHRLTGPAPPPLGLPSNSEGWALRPRSEPGTTHKVHGRRHGAPGKVDLMAPTEWKDIIIVGRTTAEEIDDRVEVEWKLSDTPELEWAEIFQMADVSERVGTLEWVLGGGPDVLHDMVRWFVPATQVEDADAEVRHRLAVANTRFGAESNDVEEDAGNGDVVSGLPDSRPGPDH